MRTVIEDDKIIVFLNKKEIKDLDFKDEENLENYFKKLFLKLNKRYEIELNGCYDIDIYKDSNYGMIIEIQDEDLDYYNYFQQVDMRINISDISSFLYEIKFDYLDKTILKYATCYKYMDKIYLKIENMDDIYFSKILECSSIIYGNIVNKILRISEKVNI